MSDIMAILTHAIPVGIIATLFMDGVILLRKRVWGHAALNYRLVGRWICHISNGHFVHDSIMGSSPIVGEGVLGWAAHYLIGVLFAAGLIAIGGWPPSFGACLLAGLLTTAAPFLIMQPSMGMGFAASNTPQPNIARRNTLLSHLSFGVGLLVGALIWSALA